MPILPTNHLKELDWSLTPDNVICGSDEVHLWRIGTSQTEQLTDRHWQSLSDNEQLRASNFVHDQDRQMFVMAHVALRELLGCYVRTPPDSVQLVSDDHGKPYLLHKGENKTVQFSLSHSGDWVLIAIAAGQVGIDVQRQREVENLPRMIRRICTSAEHQRWQQLLPEQKLPEFFCLWTSKEAVLKGAGCGLRVNPNSFEVLRSDPCEWSAALLTWKSKTTTWHVRQFAVDENHTAALAALRNDVQVRSGEWKLSRAGAIHFDAGRNWIRRLSRVSTP